MNTIIATKSLVVFGGQLYKILSASYDSNPNLGLVMVEVEPKSEEVSCLLGERILRDRGLRVQLYQPINLDNELEELRALSKRRKCHNQTDSDGNRLVELKEDKPRPTFGSAKGEVRILDGFDDPLEDFEDYL